MKLTEQKKYYDEYWSELNAISHSKRNRILAIMKELSPLCPPGGKLKILDLGCGDGRAVSVWGLYGDPHGLELSPRAVQNAKKYFPEYDIIEGDALNTPYPDNYFDIVINQEVIEHVADQIKLLEECFRILKKGGHLIITTPNKFYFDRRLGGNYSNQPIENILEPAQLKKLLKRCGFKIIKFTTIIPKKGDYGIYFLFDHILSKLPLVKQMIRLLKNRFLLSAHLIVVVEVNKN